MESIVRYGIKARFDGVCALCGAPTHAGDRLFQLPVKRGSRRWVCAACRWPDPDRVIDLPFVIRKVEHRMTVGPYTPTRAELEVLIDALDLFITQSDDEDVLMEKLVDGLVYRRSPTLGRAKMSLLLRCLERVDA